MNIKLHQIQTSEKPTIHIAQACMLQLSTYYYTTYMACLHIEK